MDFKGNSPHGGNIYKAEGAYGIKRDELLDFSANINPLGVPAELKDLIVSSLDSLVNYPDPDSFSLKSAISEYIRVPVPNIIVGNGASEVIFLYFEALKPKRVLIPAPSFSEYAQGVKRSGGEIRYFRMKEEEQFSLDIEGLIEEIKKGVDALVLCNPNNPTSRLINKEGLLKILKAAAEKGTAMVLDEAFIELTWGMNLNSISEYVTEYDNLFIVRAFTKVFAIPGLRLGYGLGSPDVIKAMEKRKIPWSVNALASCTGDFLPAAGEYLKKTSHWLSTEKKWFYGELKKLGGIKAFEPQSNFILLKLLDNSLTSVGLRDIMANKGILIRDASNFKFLDGSYIRLAIKDRESNIRLLKELRQVFEKLKN